MTNVPHVRFVSPLPADPGEQQSIVSRVEQVLEPLPGPWKVGLSYGDAVGWWILSLFREDGFECTLFLEGPLQQTTGHIRDRLADALQRHAIGLGGPGGGPPGATKPRP